MDDFFIAIEAGDVEAVQAHLVADPSLANAVDTRPPRFKSSVPRRALAIAAWKQQGAIVRLLIESGAEVNAKSAKGDTALHHVLRAPVDVDLVLFLVDRGADVNATGVNGTPLHCAIFSNSFPAIKLLVERGADVNARNRYGWTGLDYAAVHVNLKNEPAVFELLLRHGGDVRSQPTRAQGGPLLCRVARDGNPDVVRLVLDAGADVTCSNAEGTPLHHAARRGHDKIVELLLAAGADPLAVNLKCETPIDLTLRHEEILARLERTIA